MAGAVSGRNKTPLPLVYKGSRECFSLYTYEPVSTDAQGDLFSEADAAVVVGYRRKDNITDATLIAYRGFYEDPAISREDIFCYVYGLLQSPTYKETYKADLMKMLPRIPKDQTRLLAPSRRRLVRYTFFR